MNVIITGSTGMVGRGVLLECLDHPKIEQVLVINRHSLQLSHPKLEEIIHQDFFNWSGLEDQLRGFDACFFCLGVSSNGMKEAAYHRMTYDLTMRFAQTLLPRNPHMTFCYVSGAGTSSEEKGMMWARVKGKTENALLSLGFKDAYMFRPGFIKPMRGIKSRTPLYNSLYKVIKPFEGLIMKFPKWATDTVTVGRAMIEVGLSGYSKKILETEDINSFQHH
jgi:uncharacterized protein YbjT (DUF2867 family)